MKHAYNLKPLCLLVLQAVAVMAQAQEIPENSNVITIFGSGQTRQVQNITRDDLAKVLPGTSPLKTLEKLPGVSFESADPFGAYEWSTRFSVRGFNQNQLGFTLDGVPLGDMSYGNNNGLHISRAISSENIGSVTLSQGAGAVGTASTSNLGGTVQFVSSDPSEKMGLDLTQTFGANKTSRSFVRFDTGLLASGTKAYISLTRQRAEKWKGFGNQDQDQINTKLVQQFGENKISAFYNHSDRAETDYQDMALEMVGRLGWNWDNYQPDFQRAVAAARGVYTGGVTNVDDAYYLGRGLRKDDLAGLSMDLKLSDAAVLKTTVYHHNNDGQGHWYTPYTPTSSTMPISIRTTEYKISRNGLTSDLTWVNGTHTVNGGFWGENSDHTLTRNFYAVTGDADTNYFLTNPMATGFKQQFLTTQFYLQDTVAVDSKLNVNVGFKSPKVSIEATNVVGTRAAGTLTASKSVLPQIGVDYALSKNDELFASLTQNMRAFQPGVTGPFGQTQVAFNAGTPNLKPETSTTLDMGYRFKSKELNGSIAVYRADFNDRLLSVATCAGILGCPSTFVNVGKAETTGLEAAAVWSFAPHWSWFNSLTLNDSKYKSNYLDNGKLVLIDGKQVVDTPKLMFNTELSYEAANWFYRAGVKYTGKRYYTYMNDIEVPDFWVSNLSLGYKQKDLGALKDVSIQINLNNLFNKQYFSTLGSNGFAMTDPTGAFATLLSGAPRQLFTTVNAKF